MAHGPHLACELRMVFTFLTSCVEKNQKNTIP